MKRTGMLTMILDAMADQ